MECGSTIAISSGTGLVATKEGSGRRLVTGGSTMTEGRHYWEVQIKAEDDWEIQGCILLIGAVRPGIDHGKSHAVADYAYYIATQHGALWGNGSRGTDAQGGFASGDRVGVLLDLDAGWMRFYRNSKRYGPGFTKGVAGPLVHAAALFNAGSAVEIVPGAVAAEGAGDADEPW
jgi:hypothetical protein